ncbi:tryptophan 7-halogenase [Streptomyces althioticus]|jgi:flavin-dependent dehydrogenase|uniref:Tryptophan 7-halogenase n=2 Tax=Streptomyces althioticus TaxID=83380 RepID=A0ABZ1XWV4_9ACTN|nr:tryptophan halogenase family protein [Streptomyces sp. DSM 41972]WTB51113.1 tryptophan 7-halogenase [Streptomyces althioticus]SCD83640.1 tryptophan halogenase [Streptomyces sp. di50b]SCE49306.1 tryptophan halogenase [Streptomyces sp. di188]GGQ91282.1 tryptophan halogenase [Streptomyces griseorubens]
MSKSVVIVGGGTAGWMTASYLKAAFGDRLAVTLVESRNVPTIGVGEASFSTIRHFFAYLGLEESDWMPECHATYKLGIRYDNWRAEGHHFYHPFERPRTVEGVSLADWWLRKKPSADYDRDCSVIAALCEAKSSPRQFEGGLLTLGAGEQDPAAVGRSTMAQQTTQFPYAYQFDATLLAKLLTGYGTDRGVRHVLDDVVDVAVDEHGDISHVRTKESGDLSGDLFVDCTGFRSLLLNKKLGVPFLSYQDTLPNDSAVALRVPMEMADQGMGPYTRASAQAAGWIWTIPLYGRTGTGYVYASDYCTPEEAERTLRAYVGPAAEDLEANHIRMRIGRSENSWVNNCVAIGLSSGFVEPLESTGIFFIQNAIEQLVKHFPGGREDEQLRVSYNRQVAHVMDGVREFLVLHYVAAKRNDNAYWRDAKTRTMPDALAGRIEQWKVKLPDEDTIFPYYHGFEPYSYTAMILGLGGLDVQPLPGLALMDDIAAVKELQLVRDQARSLVETLPSHADYIAHVHRRRTASA